MTSSNLSTNTSFDGQSFGEMLASPADHVLTNESRGQYVAVFAGWPYANGPRHIGHAASLLPGDVTARYYRMSGANVLFASGTDEFGTPNQIAADKADLPVQEYVDGTSEQIRKDFIDLGMSFDIFTRTTSPTHEKVVHGVFEKLDENGYLEKGTMLGAFDAEDGRALPDRYIEGGCPHCSASGARGDQCDSCTSLLEPSELINPVSAISGNQVEFRDTEHWFLQLDRLSPLVKKWLMNNPGLNDSARAESLAGVDDLRPRGITRDMAWGVPLPSGYELEGEGDKVLYVWFEAVIGYLSASIEHSENTEQPDAWKRWWQNPDAKHTYAMGKDNVPFHAIMLPAILEGVNTPSEDKVATEPITPLHTPDVIASTGYLLFDSNKVSSSKGNVVRVSDFIDAVGQDTARYYMLSAGPSALRDADFTVTEVIRRNDQIMNVWGNLVSRTVTMTLKNCDGEVPADKVEDESAKSTLTVVESLFDVVGGRIESGRANRGLHAAVEGVTIVNRYLNAREPWKQFKRGEISDGRETVKTALVAIDGLNRILAPYIPTASNKVHEILGYEGVLTAQPVLGVSKSGGHEIITGDYSNTLEWTMPNLPAGQVLRPSNEHLFKPLQQSVVEARLGLKPSPTIL